MGHVFVTPTPLILPNFEFVFVIFRHDSFYGTVCENHLFPKKVNIFSTRNPMPIGVPFIHSFSSSMFFWYHETSVGHISQYHMANCLLLSSESLAKTNTIWERHKMPKMAIMQFGRKGKGSLRDPFKNDFSRTMTAQLPSLCVKTLKDFSNFYILKFILKLIKIGQINFDNYYQGSSSI